MKNNWMTVKELIYKKETLELELLGICRDRVEKFEAETPVCIKGIQIQMLDVPRLGEQKGYKVVNVVIDLDI